MTQPFRTPPRRGRARQEPAPSTGIVDYRAACQVAEGGAGATGIEVKGIKRYIRTALRFILAVFARRQPA